MKLTKKRLINWLVALDEAMNELGSIPFYQTEGKYVLKALDKLREFLKQTN